jgi:hypothetical protein
LQALSSAGTRLAFFAGSGSTSVPAIEEMRQSSGGNALHAAIALCHQVSVYGVGLVAADGVGGDATYTHFFDQEAGACLEWPRSNWSREAVRKLMSRPVVREVRQHWRRDRITTELLMHVFAALGIVRWIKS